MYSFDLIYVQTWIRPYIYSFDLIYVQVDLIYLTLDLIYQILTIYLKTDFCPIWRVIEYTVIRYEECILVGAFSQTNIKYVLAAFQSELLIPAVRMLLARNQMDPIQCRREREEEQF